MSNKIILKKSSVGAKVPLTTDLEYGELALNYADGKLYFKDSSNAIQFLGSSSATETLSNKSLTSPSLSGTVTLTSTTLLSINGTTGNTGQYLARGPTGLSWSNPPSPALSNLSDVVISSAQPQQVLTFTGSAWINADSNAVVASAVFATSQSDLGYVYDSNVTVTENLGPVTEVAYNIYDLGVLSFTGIISLNNIDQSVKSDYLGYSIIFGF
jgi:hypothetical protein